MRSVFREFVARVRAQSDIVELIGADVDLRPAGSTLKALSPFQHEKTPSFVVWPATQSWHDFSNGGGRGGDVFAYVQERDKIGFKDAVYQLAERAGIRRTAQDDASWKRDLAELEERRNVERIFTAAATYYHRALPVEMRREYLHDHYGFSDETVNSLRLGWADGHLFEHVTTKLGASRELALKSGLFVLLASGRVVDFFCKRLVFPYWRSGSVVYFIGRRTDATGDQEWEKAKYKKLPTGSAARAYVSLMVQNDYFYNEDATRHADELLVTEGVTDCLAALQAGIPCISPVTTRFRKQDLPKLLELTRQTKRVVICNDTEASGAGEAGALITAAALFREGRDVRIATLPRPDGVGKRDLNEFLRAHSAEEFRTIVAGAKRYLEFVVDSIPTDTHWAELDRRLDPILDEIVTAPPLERDGYLEMIVKRFEIKRKTLNEKVRSRKDSEGGASRPKSQADNGSVRPAARVSDGAIESGERTRPRIIKREEIAYEADEAEQALLEDPELELYARGDILVEVVPSAATSAPLIRAIPIANLRDRIARAAEYGKYEESEDDEAPVWKRLQTPLHLAQTLDARGKWSFPTLRGVVETPTLREDGSILTKPGYDAATQLLMRAGDFSCQIPETPTRDDAKEAFEILKRPFNDFRFSDAAKTNPCSAIIAAILSLLARHAIRGPVPLFGVTGTKQGCGKGLLVDAITLIATGRRAMLTPAPERDDEWRKRILSIGLAGTCAVSIDNVNGTLRSASLAAAIATEEYSDRGLGHNRMITVPMTTVWFATGNGMSFDSDMARRVIPIYLDPGIENPEARTDFQHDDLRDAIRRMRAELVTAGLTILRAYAVAGRPSHPWSRLGTFESWDRWIRGAVHWLGAGDACEGRKRLLEEGDCENEALIALLVTWHRTFADSPVTMAKLREEIGKSRLRELASAIIAFSPPKVGREADTTELGYALRRVRGRTAGGLKFERLAKKLHGATQWIVTGSPDERADGDAGGCNATAECHPGQVPVFTA